MMPQYKLSDHNPAYWPRSICHRMFSSHYSNLSQQDRDEEQEFAEAARESSSLLGNDNLKKNHDRLSESDPKDDEDDSGNNQNREKSKSFLSSKEFNYVVLGLLGACTLLYLILNQVAPGTSDRLSDWVISSGFLHSYILILASSIGDKTFFITALIAAKFGKCVAFTGSVTALLLMTAASVMIGVLFHSMPQVVKNYLPYDHCIAIVMFMYYGIKSLYEAVQSLSRDGDTTCSVEDDRTEAGLLVEDVQKEDNISLSLTAFSLVYIAEIGDKSMFACIALAATQEPVGVFFGASLGHITASIVAVFAGTIMSEYLSDFWVTLISGICFITFAIICGIDLYYNHVPDVTGGTASMP